MTISRFISEAPPESSWTSWGTPKRRLYRAWKQLEAAERQERFDAEVAQVAREQNCEEVTARYVLNARRRFEHRRGAAQAQIARDVVAASDVRPLVLCPRPDKVAHRAKEKAESSMTWLRARGERGLCVYRCCDHWHVGHIDPAAAVARGRGRRRAG